MKTKSYNSFKNLNINLRSKIFGQDHAIDKITDTLKINSLGLGDKDKPIGSFLFTGPTGVGKTELAIQLSKELKMNFKRFDMSEYSEKYSVKNFIGGDAGLVGYDDGGLLVNYMLDYPNSVLLFDEIEKAHKEVMNIFLQILDYGHLTSTKGEEVLFKNTIIIFTSNLGIKNLQLRKSIGFISNYILEEDFDDENEINSFLKPEFRGRVESIIPFNCLNKKMILSIINKNIKELTQKLNSYNLSISMSIELKKMIVEDLIKDNLGARSIAKIFKDKIKILIANEILNNKIKFNSNILIDLNKEINQIYLEISSKSENDKKDLLSFINDDTLWFSDVKEAQEFAKQNTGISITRSPCGNGFIAKKD